MPHSLERLLRNSAALTLVLLLAAFIAGALLTRGGDPALESGAPPALSATSTVVDQAPLTRARALAARAVTPQEEQYATAALKLADHAVDLAFDAALREAATASHPLTSNALSISQRIAEARARAAADQAEVDRLSRPRRNGRPATELAGSGPTDAGNADPALTLARARLALDRDALEDLQQDLVAAGGDPRARIQAALDEHRAAEAQSVSQPKDAAAMALERQEALMTVPGKLRALAALHQRQQQLAAAEDETRRLAAGLGAEHARLEAANAEHARLEAANAEHARLEAANAGPGQKPAAEAAGKPVLPPGADTASTTATASSNAADALLMVERLHRQGALRQAMASLDARVRDLDQLAVLYGQWRQAVLLDRRAVLNRLFRAGAVVCVMMLVLAALGHVLRAALDRRIEDRRRRNHLRILTSLVLQVTGLAYLLLVFFGPPRNLSTMLGLATAALAVVMKDFILALFGWLLLMGRNGLRVGDWVEINGVTGEVVELSLLRTVLLETGNWNEPGHPTGRRVAFMNGFAIEGRYFNFSTRGQWLFDELRIPLSSGATPGRPGVDAQAAAIERALSEAMAPAAERARSEWQRLAPQALGVFSAPSFELRPTAGGMELVARYITQAQDRLDTRARLYREIRRVLATPEGS